MEVKEGYKKTEVGVIPEDWEVDIIDNVCSITTGNKNTQDRIDGAKYPFFVRSQTIERIDTFSFDGEAVLTAGDGVGTGKVFHYINDKFDFHQRVYKMSHFKENMNGYFFYLYFSNHFYDRIMQMTAKSSVDSVRREMIANMKILIPTLPEQQTIATVLSDTDNLIQALEKKIAKKELIKKGAMQQLLEPKEGWEVKTLGEIGESIIGLTYSPNDVDSVGTLVLRSSNIQNNQLAFHDNVYVNMKLPSRVIVEENDILICVRNGSKRLIGKCTLIKKKIAGSAFGAFMTVYRSQYSKFIVHVFQSDYIQKQIDEIMGATINQITNKDLASFIVPFPPINEQNHIAQILSDMNTEIESLQEKLSKYKQLNQGLMQELLTGKIRLV